MEASGISGLGVPRLEEEAELEGLSKTFPDRQHFPEVKPPQFYCLRNFGDAYPMPIHKARHLSVHIHGKNVLVNSWALL